MNRQSPAILVKSDLMDSRERIHTIFREEEPDRVGYWDADFFADTVQRWRQEGLPEGVDCKEGAHNPLLNVAGLTHFGMDIYITQPDCTPKFDVIEYETSDDWTIMKDAYGTTTKWPTRKSVTPRYLDPIVKSPQDFVDKVEPLLDPEDMRRVSSPRYPFKDELTETMERMKKRFFVAVGMPGPFAYSMLLCGGLAPTLRFMMKHQEFMKHMFSSIADFLARIDQSYLECGADGLWVFDDQGWNKGPFYSPKIYAKLLKPAHEIVCDPFKRKSLPRILHSDGHVEPFIPDFIESGFNALQPLQIKAGMDLARLKEKYGKELTLMGGIDTDILGSGDFEAIRNEVKTKIAAGGKGGGYIVTCDGPVPPTVSLRSYECFVKAITEYGNYPHDHHK